MESEVNTRNAHKAALQRQQKERKSVRQKHEIMKKHKMKSMSAAPRAMLSESQVEPSVSAASKHHSTQQAEEVRELMRMLNMGEMSKLKLALKKYRQRYPMNEQGDMLPKKLRDLESE
jgi:hypothetical protein